MKTTSQSPTLNVKNLWLFLLMLMPAGAIYSQSDQPATGKLIITFTDIRSEVGNIALGLYTAAEQWTDNPAYNYYWDKKNMVNGTLTVEIEKLPRGIYYACAVLDDEDKSFTMNYTVGLPNEGWGMSTNPSFLKLKKPRFDEVSFELDAPAIRTEIKLNYLNRKKKVVE